MPNLEPLQIIIRGKHDTGRTTIAALLKEALEVSGFALVSITDTEPLPPDEKPEFAARLSRNLKRPIRISVELAE